jgi:hypothetical protein
MSGSVRAHLWLSEVIGAQFQATKNPHAHQDEACKIQAPSDTHFRENTIIFLALLV